MVVIVVHSGFKAVLQGLSFMLKGWLSIALIATLWVGGRAFLVARRKARVRCEARAQTVVGAEWDHLARSLHINLLAYTRGMH